VRDRDHVNVVRRAPSQGREWSCCRVANEATRGRVIVGEEGRVSGHWVARVVKWAGGGLQFDPKELNR